MNNFLSTKREEILQLAKEYGAYNIRVFGSVSRGEETETSDVDFLIDLEDGRSLLDVGGLVMDLQELLGKKVDVVTEEGLHWYIKKSIQSEAIPL